MNKLKIALIIWGFFFVTPINSQKSSNIDSLEQVYNGKLFKTTNDELKLLRLLSRESPDPEKKLRFSSILITRSRELDSAYYLYDAYVQKGNALMLKSDLSKALESFLTAAEVAQKSSNRRDAALVNIPIGDVYSIMGNHENSIYYYNTGIKELRVLKDSINLASALLNAGDEYFNKGKYDKAQNLFLESSYICQKINYKIGAAYNLGNLGMLYAKQNKTKRAEINMNEAIKILEEESDYYPISDYLNYMAEIYLQQKEPLLALKYSQKSLNLATKYGLKEQISNANLKLSKIYDSLSDLSKSFYHYKQHIKFKDSINNVLNVQKLANLRTTYEVGKKQLDVDFLSEQKKDQILITIITVVILILISLLAFGLYKRNKIIYKTNSILAEERTKSDKLLKNILPGDIAEELKRSGKVIAKKHQSVTVLFTDFQGFTKHAELLEPEELVKLVDMYFSKFDMIINKYKLEKIKTIGDAYMCAGGLPKPTNNHAESMVLAAQEILSYVEEVKQVHRVNEVRFDIRIGIHTGPVVAGVVGEEKFSYDIWGDTVNIASRIESSCEPGKINISESTYELIKDKYTFENRGEVEIKNRTPIKMFYLAKNKNT